jgi:hypothetical protein
MTRELDNGELAMKVTQLIGLGEVGENLYEELKKYKCFNGNLLRAYQDHQKSQQFLIKYQKYIANEK